MTGSDLAKFHQQAAQRWPSVCWDAESYAQHVGDTEPPHPLDLYLAGAAGYRVNAAWEAIETEDGDFVRVMLLRKPLADFTPEDLWQETITRQRDEDAGSPMLPTGKRLARIIKYRGLVELRTYLIVCAGRLAKDRHRKCCVSIEMTPPCHNRSVTPRRIGLNPPDGHFVDEYA